MGTFVHQFLMEILSIARAQVRSRGGNALMQFQLHDVNIIEQNKSQAYAIVALSGDAVKLVGLHD